MINFSYRFGMDNTIYLLNTSTNVSDAEVAQMAAACAKQVAQHVAPAHFVLPAPVIFLPKSAEQPGTQARILSVQDTLDDPSALGFHTQDGSEHIWGVVGTKTLLDQGAKVLTGDYAVSTVVSHEVCELFMDPWCSMWADSGQGFSVSFEICDPVQADLYEIDGVAVSNFVTGPWFNPWAASSDTFDYLGKLSGPFTMDAGGYWVESQGGQQTQKFGRAVPEWVQRMKTSAHTRISKLADPGFPTAG